MKRRMKTILLLASLATLIAAVPGSDQTDEGERLWETNVTSHVHLEIMSTDVDDDDSEKPQVSLCCRIGTFLIKDDCVEDTTNETDAVQLPIIYGTDLTSENITASDEHFSFVVWNPCINMNRYLLHLNTYQDEMWYLLSNGSILRPLAKEPESHLLNYHQYCLARVRNASISSMDNKYQKYSVFYCVDPKKVSKEIEEEEKIVYTCGMLISEPFLLATYIVYCLLPDLRNLHGLTLRKYVGCLTISYGLMSTMLLAFPKLISSYICKIIAFIITFTFSASFFWLNVMCFDIWWTFGKFRSIQGNIKQREKKRFIIYSIYVWVSASVLIIICAITDFGLVASLKRPEFCTRGFYWFGTDLAQLLYFWGPMGITIVCNMCLFISMAVKLVRHKKYMAHHLKDSQFRRGDEKRFNLYLKLFFLMGVSWSMEVVSWTLDLIFDNVPMYIWYITDLTNVLQGIFIFIIFVWKKKIKLLLLKRLGCHDRILFWRNSTSRDCNSLDTEEVHLESIINSCRGKNSSLKVNS